MKKLLCILLLVQLQARSQEATDYKKPPKLLEDLLLAPPTPSVSIDDKGKYMLLSERSSNYPGVEELAQPELRIAGLRINPNNFGPSRQVYTTNFKIKNMATGAETAVKGLPANLKASGPTWNPSQTKIAFAHTNNAVIDLYEIDVTTAVAKKVNKQPLNLVYGPGYEYLDDNTLMYGTTTAPAVAAPPKPLAPKGPVAQQNLGKAAPSRTYQDLIKTPYDEQLFGFYATAQLVLLKNGLETKLGKPDIYAGVTPSPNKQFLLVETIKKPFSYLVPANGFPSTVSIADLGGKTIKVLAELPSSETSPSGFDNVQNVPRGFNWMANEPAVIMWGAPLDSGIYKTKVPYHDAVYSLAAPFAGATAEVAKTTMRYRGITWGDNGLGLLSEGSQGKQMAKVSLLNPATGSSETLFERSTNDAYNNPGTPVLHDNKFGRSVFQTVDGGKGILMTGEGASAKGDLPFLSVFDVATKKSNILWRSQEPYYESVVKVLDADKKLFISRKESLTDAPNFYLHDLTAGSNKPITSFPDPQPALRGLIKEKIYYKRKDGIDLTATVYLPAGFKAGTSKPLPIFMWAYPREFKSAADAAQVRGSQYRFSGVSWGSPVFYAAMGYCVMDATEFPIVGEGDKQPNDNFVEQLEWNAKAALDKIAALGYGDTSRAAVGGHSYGAFMTANLLTHSRMFKAGIARSGAYMRTLTPFGFQNEERTYWQAPEVYYQMSPFSFANNMKDALLLIHGDADNNPGTFPINSERLYNAIKGHGGTVRFVSLPYESHGYSGRENVLHMLHEQYEWLEKYVKQGK